MALWPMWQRAQPRGQRVRLGSTPYCPGTEGRMEEGERNEPLEWSQVLRSFRMKVEVFLLRKCWEDSSWWGSSFFLLLLPIKMVISKDHWQWGQAACEEKGGWVIPEYLRGQWGRGPWSETGKIGPSPVTGSANHMGSEPRTILLSHWTYKPKPEDSMNLNKNYLSGNWKKSKLKDTDFGIHRIYRI